MKTELMVGSELVKRRRSLSYPSGTVTDPGTLVTIVGSTPKTWELSDDTLVSKTTLEAKGSLFTYSVS